MYTCKNKTKEAHYHSFLQLFFPGGRLEIRNISQLLSISSFESENLHLSGVPENANFMPT